MGQLHDARKRAAATLLASSLLLAGCSSSSDSPALPVDDTLASDIDSVSTTAQPEADPISDAVSVEDIVSASGPIEEISEPAAPIADSVPAETNTDEENLDRNRVVFG